MVRKKQQPANPMRMYRHFAVITVALTGTMALFADGENRKAIAEEIAAREQRNELARANAEKFGKPRLVRKAPEATAGKFGPEPGGEFGQPMDDAGGGNSGGYIPDYADAAPPAHVPAAYGYFGLSPSEWEALSEEQREELRRQVRAGSALAASEERERQIERLRAASAARAGGSREES